jgi:hypothetical protein
VIDVPRVAAADHPGELGSDLIERFPLHRRQPGAPVAERGFDYPRQLGGLRKVAVCPLAVHEQGIDPERPMLAEKWGGRRTKLGCHCRSAPARRPAAALGPSPKLRASCFCVATPALADGVQPAPEPGQVRRRQTSAANA